MKEYGDNIMQLNVEKQQLLNLEEQKNEIMQKCFCKTVKTPKIIKKNIYDPEKQRIVLKTGYDETFFIKGKGKKAEPFLDYLEELEIKNIDTKIESCKSRIKQLERRIARMEIPLSNLKGYEKRIYLKMLEGLNITQAVKLVAEETEKSDRTMWRYVKKLKETLKKYNLDKKFDIFL